MTICREWWLVKQHEGVMHAKMLVCRSWSCDYCRPQRRSKLMAQAASGAPDRFLTLTVNPRVGQDPADRLRLLARAWRLCVKRLRRINPDAQIEYLAVAEETKQGEPHLHILLRSPYIRQQYISAVMSEIIDSPIVDIRKIRNPHEVIRYVAKYVSKQPAQFGTAKRYWFSQHYDLNLSGYQPSLTAVYTRWHVDRRALDLILFEWISNGFAPRRDGDVAFIGLPISEHNSLPPPWPMLPVPTPPSSPLARQLGLETLS